jgi:hypothetical protein
MVSVGFGGGSFLREASLKIMVCSWLRRIAREVPVDDPSSHRNKY